MLSCLCGGDRKEETLYKRILNRTCEMFLRLDYLEISRVCYYFRTFYVKLASAYVRVLFGFCKMTDMFFRALVGIGGLRRTLTDIINRHKV